MQTYPAILFDLDGTLINSLEDIADAMNHTLSTFDLPTHPYESYKHFIGKGLKNLVKSCVPPTVRDNPETIDRCLQTMVAHYRQNLTNKTCLYPGIAELLDTLTEKGIKMAILSNKADALTQQICAKLLHQWSFEVIMGATDDFPRKPNPEAALFIAKKMQIAPGNILYIGDSNVDMQTARAAGMFPVGVTWGFRTREELEEAGARVVIEGVMELMGSGYFM